MPTAVDPTSTTPPPRASGETSPPPGASGETPPPPDARERELVLAIVATHTGSLLAIARRHSLCADDAHDAFQRAMEILLRRAGSLDATSAPAWLRTVVKHEALAVRAARRRLVGPREVDLDLEEASELDPADERVAATERVERSTEALARLRPQHVRALLLRARGYSYREIAEITGWSHTKVNRCVSEGRRAFLDRYADIEAGRECERWTSVLSALADGEASAAEVAAARPHLRCCPACRSRLRDFRAAPRALAAAAPAALLESVGEPGPGAGLAARLHEGLLGGLQERLLLSAHKLHAGAEALATGKLAAVAASATALAGGGAAVLRDGVDHPPTTPAAVAEAPGRASRGPARPRAAAPARRASRRPTPAGSRRRSRVVRADGRTPTSTEFDAGPSTPGSRRRAVSAPVRARVAAASARAPSPSAQSSQPRSPSPEFGP